MLNQSYKTDYTYFYSKLHNEYVVFVIEFITFFYTARDGLLRWHQKHSVTVAGVGHSCVWLHESVDVEF
jgi:hypothetical protein